MCLWIETGEKPKTAEEVIQVYKVLTNQDTAPLWTKYTYHSGINHPEAEPENDTFPDNDGEMVGQGYLFAYLSYYRAEQKKFMLELVYENLKDNLKIVEMEIPAGTEYYRDSWGEVAARALEWKKEND